MFKIILKRFATSLIFSKLKLVKFQWSFKNFSVKIENCESQFVI